MTSDDNDNARMLALMDAMFHGQKRTLTLVEAAIDKFSIVETELSKLNRKMNAMHEVTLRQHGEVMNRFDAFDARMTNRFDAVDARMMNRFDAIVARMEETERLLDDRSLDIKRTQIDIVGQYNEILTALQLSTNASRDVEELDERLSDLERRMQV